MMTWGSNPGSGITKGYPFWLYWRGALSVSVFGDGEGGLKTNLSVAGIQRCESGEELTEAGSSFWEDLVAEVGPFDGVGHA